QRAATASWEEVQRHSRHARAAELAALLEQLVPTVPQGTPQQSAHPTFHFDKIGPRVGLAERVPRLEGRLFLTYNARGALFQLLRAFPDGRQKPILLPAFHCDTVVEPVLRAGYEVIFYRVRRDLSMDYEDIASKMSRGVAAIVVINYCGFPVDLAPMA